MSTLTPVTAEQLLQMPHDGCRYELVEGELRMMSPCGWRHGKVGGRLLQHIARYLAENPCGEAFLAETGFLLSRDPDTVRAPDIAFIHKDRLSGELPEEAFWPGAPDLAVEVVSPGDTYREVDEKAKKWIAAGAKLVWVVNPLQQTVNVYRPDGLIGTLGVKDELTGEVVLPGFRCRVGEIFAGA
jgi:Uma2 family endonuclease